MDVGLCAAGSSLCLRGQWQSCENFVLPSTETCDGVDNDCDAEVDEGVLSACRVCGTCSEVCFGLGDGCEGWHVQGHVGFRSLDGALVPESRGDSPREVAWIPSYWEGVVYRVDAMSLETEASFWTGSGHGFSGDRPGQVVVDLEGHAIIANEANGGIASITKIARDASSCVDRDGDGSLLTSTAWDDRLDFRTGDDWDDDCILWHTELGDEGAVAPVLADVDVGERGWVGMNPSARFLEFDPDSGELTGAEVSTGERPPIGAAADRQGWIWYAAYDGVGRFDAFAPERGAEIVDAVSFDGLDVHNVIVDENDVPWVGGDQLWRWSPVWDEFVSVELPDRGWQWGFGYTAASDGQGTVWAGSRSDAAELFRITNDGELQVDVVPLESGGHLGIGVDSRGRVWAVPGNPAGAATAVYDPSSGIAETALDDCGGESCIAVVNETRGDFSGQQLRNVRRPAQSVERIIASCDDSSETRWAALSVDAEVSEDDVVRVDARTAQSAEALSIEPWTVLGRVPQDGYRFDLRQRFGTSGSFLEFRAVIEEVSESEPMRIRTIAVEFGCQQGPV
jgi:sugar lactone lactonase YvrE